MENGIKTKEYKVSRNTGVIRHFIVEAVSYTAAEEMAKDNIKSFYHDWKEYTIEEITDSNDLRKTEDSIVEQEKQAIDNITGKGEVDCIINEIKIADKAINLLLITVSAFFVTGLGMMIWTLASNHQMIEELTKH